MLAHQISGLPIKTILLTKPPGKPDPRYKKTGFNIKGQLHHIEV
jgi:hypothetical protein